LWGAVVGMFGIILIGRKMPKKEIWQSYDMFGISLPGQKCQRKERNMAI
jgi:hypothetical protein